MSTVVEWVLGLIMGIGTLIWVLILYLAPRIRYYIYLFLDVL